MAKIVLRECRVREDKLALVRDKDPIVVDWFGFKELLTVSGEERKMLGMVRPTSYIGRTKAKKLFYFFNERRQNTIDFMIKANPEFGANIDRVYQVESVRWDAKTQEMSTKELPPGN